MTSWGFNLWLSPKLINNKKLRERQLAAPSESEDLQSLVTNELKDKKNTAAGGLLWLVRLVRPLITPKAALTTTAGDSTLPPKDSDIISLIQVMSSQPRSEPHTPTLSSPTIRS